MRTTGLYGQNLLNLKGDELTVLTSSDLEVQIDQGKSFSPSDCPGKKLKALNEERKKQSKLLQNTPKMKVPKYPCRIWTKYTLL